MRDEHYKERSISAIFAIFNSDKSHSSVHNSSPGIPDQTHRPKTARSPCISQRYGGYTPTQTSSDSRGLTPSSFSPLYSSWPPPPSLHQLTHANHVSRPAAAHATTSPTLMLPSTRVTAYTRTAKRKAQTATHTPTTTTKASISPSAGHTKSSQSCPAIKPTMAAARALTELSSTPMARLQVSSLTPELAVTTLWLAQASTFRRFV